MDTLDTFTGEVSCPKTLEELIAGLRHLVEKRKKQQESHRAEHRRRKTPRGKAREEVLMKNRQAVSHLWRFDRRAVASRSRLGLQRGREGLT
jgi:hypothetical protein